MKLNSKGFEENLFYSDGSGNGRAGFIRTVSGNYLNIFEPNPQHIEIDDIIHALCFIPRWGGHIHNFFSVGHHSINCALQAIEEGLYADDVFSCLMHDSSEGYLMDICSPIKKGLTNYYEIEDCLMKVMAKKFGFIYPLSENVKRIDKFQLEYEWNYKILVPSIAPEMKIENVKKVFMDYFNQYKP